ncbi:MAG TPA: zinc ribbon domain-containing protein [Nitrososphaeria archaeon]|nr:MAG: hypothetical protein DRN68_00245 [Nitrososphaerota archaeon]HDJ66958.1 zinc ribbon domain-containing protein [Nitrososphaeria archaeon]
MTPLMLVGVIVSIIGVSIALGVTFYYLSLPLEAPFRKFLDSTLMGMPYLLYFVIVGGALSGVGLLIYVKAVRSGVAVTHRRRGPMALTRPALRRPSASLPGRAPKPKGAVTSPDIVEEIEKEIEEIVKGTSEVPETVEEKPAAVEEVKQPLVKVISRANDMVCPHCGSLNPIGSVKCSNCKKKFYEPDDPSKSCPVCGAPLKLSKRISEKLFVCGICFSELEIAPELQKSLKL